MGTNNCCVNIHERESAAENIPEGLIVLGKELGKV